MNLPHTTSEGKCDNCGSGSMTLAVDQTQYTPYAFDQDYWSGDSAYTDEMSNDDPRGNVRFFCADCGSYHQVPRELT